MIGPKEKALSGTMGVLAWIIGRISSLKRFSSIGRGLAGKWWNHHPLKCTKYGGCGTLRPRFSGGHVGGAMLMVGLDYFRGLSQS